MPQIGAPLEATSPSTQAMATGIAAPSLVFQPGGTRAANTYVTEALLQQACTPAAGMNGSFPIYVDLTLSSDAYAAGGALALGASTSLLGVVNQTNGVVPALSTAFTLTPPAELRDVALSCTLAGTVFTSSPKVFRVSGQGSVACGASATLYAVAAAGAKLFLDGHASLGDGTHKVVSVGAAGTLAIYVAPGAALNAAALSITAGGAVTIFASPGSTIATSYIGMTGVTIVGGGGGGSGPVLDVYAATLLALETGLSTVAAESFSASRFYCNFSNVTLPSGAYSVGVISEWVGDPTAAIPAAVTLAAGVTWTQFPTTMRAVYFHSPTAPTGAVWSGQDIACELVDALVSAPSTISHPLIDVSSQTLVFDLRGVSQVSGTAGVGTSGVIDMVTLGAGYSVTINLYDGSGLGAFAFGAQLLAYAAAHAGSLVINRYSEASTVDASLLAYVVDFVPPATNLLFQPGGTKGPGVYTDEASLLSACQPIRAPKTVWLDFSFVGDAYSTIGVWNLGPLTTLRGLLNQTNGAYPVLSLDGGQMSAPVEISDFQLSPVNTGAAFTSAPPKLTISGNTSFDPNTGAYLYSATPGATTILVIRDTATLNGGTPPSIVVPTGALMDVLVLDFAELLTGGIAVTGAGVIGVEAALGTTIDPSYFSATGVTIRYQGRPTVTTTTSAAVHQIDSVYGIQARADTTTHPVSFKLPSVANIQDGFECYTSLDVSTGANPMTVVVNGTASEQLKDPQTGQLLPTATAWSTAPLGNRANTRVMWKWYKAGNFWASY